MKGDLKFMVQCLNLERHAGREEVAWKSSFNTMLGFLIVGLEPLVFL